jgi:hypothetical protein
MKKKKFQSFEQSKVRFSSIVDFQILQGEYEIRVLIVKSKVFSI